MQVRNGRLAMLATLGFFSQAAVTQTTPLQNLYDHLDDPGHRNSAFLVPTASLEQLYQQHVSVHRGCAWRLSAA